LHYYELLLPHQDLLQLLLLLLAPLLWVSLLSQMPHS
jgi:hypothetical protein